MITAIYARNKVKFVLGTTPRPKKDENKDDPTFSAWKRCNNMVAS